MILCMVLKHAPGGRQVWNDGYSFSRCGRCGRELIRSDGQWAPVPRGHRIVWKRGRHRHSLEAQYLRLLPLPLKTRGRALQPDGLSWHRRLMRLVLAARAAPQPLVPDGEEIERDEHQYPYGLAIAAIVGASMQLLLRYRAHRSGRGRAYC
jgi:hypothetical protein